ncbi:MULTISPECIES: enoyl-CoA hydratase/isomerase family protein [Aliiglaciecola]|uniref:enoyl-CoA hydratase/isomerase family protein n=1 Tax=Aliiglaciecola TaxID=1406885 RepID=UPI001C085D34|nr:MULTISPECIES: enoyl-CoA hydratase/isomerase family protein [Aliiglaciecola]MBU2877338.1 enoyl-CoA hydratase/isomerase family protein [Aliiglaciecola lipolytica]MDO6712986.1 enoyl-CoA hydratase/isomerase family protein [Aliiglaciecola sp. 2_MG-2023]MDO6754025.1 enoyl-CoA hydratase/isomerase family protein [Aliiglaciecola sp. 1_MG-2023]
MELPVVFDIQTCKNGKSIGIATLNRPKSLNALDLEMVNLLLLQLQSWQHNNDIAIVVLDSRGDSTFCAGGDVVSMYNAMKDSKTEQNNPAMVPELLETFFSQEYRLDYLIHTYPKPILAWGNGIIMGGGLGLLAGASHRVVTEDALIAMPEAAIGLYPDVGGSWFLNKMPKGVGQFLGVTGAKINCHDAKFANLADFVIQHQNKLQVLRQIKTTDWTENFAQNGQLLTALCAEFAQTSGVCNLHKHADLLAGLADTTTLQDYIDALTAVSISDDKWFKKAQDAIAYNSPISMHLVFQQLHRGVDLSLAECFQMELIMSCRCGTYGEFQEGVRALLIDKDRKPKWAFANIAEVDEKTLNQFFTSMWPNNGNPLNDLQLAS